MPLPLPPPLPPVPPPPVPPDEPAPPGVPFAPPAVVSSGCSGTSPTSTVICSVPPQRIVQVGSASRTSTCANRMPGILAVAVTRWPSTGPSPNSHV